MVNQKSLQASYKYLVSSGQQRYPRVRNVIIINYDDIGRWDYSGIHDVEGEYLQPFTPSLDIAIAGGVTFDNFITKPVCSPTRSCFLTGKQPYMTGQGTVISNANPAEGFEIAHEFLPTIIKRFNSNYTCAAFGKWHLNNPSGTPIGHAMVKGFDIYQGSPENLGVTVGIESNNSFYDYGYHDNISITRETTYDTNKIGDDVVSFIESAQTPFFASVSFHAAHTPFTDADRPPTDTHTTPAITDSDIASGGKLGNNNFVRFRERWASILESIDTAQGRIFDALTSKGILEDTLVLIFGDNGMDRTAAPSSIDGVVMASGTVGFTPDRFKTAVHDSGSRGFCVAYGGGATNNVSTSAGVEDIDVFATVLEFIGATDPTLQVNESVESNSFLGAIIGAPWSKKSFLYSEHSIPAGATLGGNLGSEDSMARAVKDDSYQLIISNDTIDVASSLEFYDLISDPFELDNLVSSVGDPSGDFIEYLNLASSDTYLDLSANMVSRFNNVDSLIEFYQ